MRVRIEPKEFFMYSVFLAFDHNSPDAEDQEVLAYLEQHELEAKRQGKQVVDDVEYNVMQFGGCYLGKHLNNIGDMQRNSVQREMLSEAIEQVLSDSKDHVARQTADNTPEPRMKEIIAGMAQEFHDESSFGSDEDGYLTVALDPAVIEQKFVEMAGAVA